MSTLHIVQAGTNKSNIRWLEQAARLKLSGSSWIVPKDAKKGHELVIFVIGHGFFATARVASEKTHPRNDWGNRYGAAMDSVRLITPPISLAAIEINIPELIWAKYPRSLTTPKPEVAEQIRVLIKRRRKYRLPDLDDKSLDNASIDELRCAALMSARSVSARKMRKVYQRIRSRAIHLYVLKRAKGVCEACCTAAPFIRVDGRPYLEPHHTTRLADEGPDHPDKVIGLCPNCHRCAHYAANYSEFNQHLVRRLAVIERNRSSK